MGFSFALPGSSDTNTGSVTASVDPIGIKKALLEIEYDKVGGKENYDVITKAQLLSLNDPQNPNNINAIKQYVGVGTGSATSQKPTVSPVTSSQLSQDEIVSLLSGAVIEGNKNANIIAIEFTDMECPFCVKQYSETKLQPSLKAQYGDQVSFVFKNNRGVNHPGTEAKAIATLCAKKIGGENAYTKFYHGVMDGNTGMSASQMYPLADLPKLAKTIGLDSTKWQSCVDSKATMVEFAAETAQAQKYGLSGTPGTLLVNVKTWKYATVEGAYPFSEFMTKIASIQ